MIGHQLTDGFHVDHSFLRDACWRNSAFQGVLQLIYEYLSLSAINNYHFIHFSYVYNLKIANQQSTYSRFLKLENRIRNSFSQNNNGN